MNQQSNSATAPIEWSDPDDRLEIRGWLRGHPEITLFLIRLCDDRPDRGTMTGAFVPDDQDGVGHLQRGLIDWLKTSAVIYLREFRDLLNELDLENRTAPQATQSVVMAAISGYLGNREALVKALGALDYTYGNNAKKHAEDITREIVRIDEALHGLLSRHQ